MWSPKLIGFSELGGCSVICENVGVLPTYEGRGSDESTAPAGFPGSHGASHRPGNLICYLNSKQNKTKMIQKKTGISPNLEMYQITFVHLYERNIEGEYLQLWDEQIFYKTTCYQYTKYISITLCICKRCLVTERERESERERVGNKANV